MKTITAGTVDQAEFFRVLNWSYDQGDLATLLHTVINGAACELKVTLPENDARLAALAAELSGRWSVSVSPTVDHS
jgi:hypothetical protein